MNKIKQKSNIIKRKLRVRKKISGTSSTPRLSVYRSNNYIYGQLIDDTAGKTLISLSLNDIKSLHESAKSKTEASYEAGKKLAQVAKENSIESVVFDRNGYKYHGRIKSFAEGAREGGLVF